MSKTVRLWDAHCHLDDPKLEGRLDAWIATAKQTGLKGLTLSGIHPDQWARQNQTAHALQTSGLEVRQTIGLHPWWVLKHSSQECEQAFKKLEAALPDTDGLGELGLDLFKGSEETLPHQEFWFRQQLSLAVAQDQLLVLHVVQAHSQALQILKEFAPKARFRGLVHSFSGSWEQAKQYLDLGFSISVSGVIVRQKGFESLKRAVLRIPRDKLLIETDSPDQPIEGEIQPPHALSLIAARLAELRGESVEAFCAQTTDNAEALFCKR